MFTQLIRIGRDAELRYTQSGKAVCSIAGAYDVGYGDNKKTQWIDCALWEKRAESLAQYLVKGQQCMVTLDDVHIDIYEGQNGPKATLKARVVDLKLCGSKPSGAQNGYQAPQNQGGQNQGHQSNQQQGSQNQGYQQQGGQNQSNQNQGQQQVDDDLDGPPF